ncbi:signal peptide peptidase SppA [Rubellicoccus peritrichatus]|uniref:Signal peptide peptidase SppA n=1 Tax=Rubellicoccus peritrichatus TaxID=3080537 RepID=A0AAQ3L6P0_9BACT|nr:signal peptide peptidase SppA [Puniceicoccus sp. CR14]WOO39996.1 signal peptide peptidase SppA [Puniceicoccus sp. CR14]
MTNNERHTARNMTIRKPRDKKPNIFLSSLLGNLAAMSIMAGLFFGGGIYLLVVLSLAAGGQEKASVPNNAVLVVDLWMNISDSPPVNDVGNIFDEAIWGPSTRNLYLLEVVDAIDRAATDDRIEALFLQGSLLPENYGSGLAALREVRDAIGRFKASGKAVYAYTTDPSLRDFYLMSTADNLTMNPFGVLGLNGLASEMMFLGNAFDKYGIGVQTTRVGKYKSAVEVFTEEKMSPANREQVAELLTDIWEQIVFDIADSRAVDPEELLELANTRGFFSAETALEMGLVDEVGYFDEVIDELETVADFDWDYDTFEQIGIATYIKSEGFRSKTDIFSSASKVAVVYAEGDIVGGEGFPDQVGGERLARELRSLRDDPDVAAIVLRVNSPGGSAVAAELIQREIVLAQNAGMPVIVSMGSLAASGGYWISASADKIYAEPTTITGSIGVWGLMFNFKDLANEHGVTFDGVKTSEFADLYTISREKTVEEMALIQEFTDFIYDEFIEKVATGRGMTLEAVQEIAQGRVWTGEQAHEIGLVDELGGLEDAISYAAKASDLGDDWMVIQVPEKRNLSEAISEFLAAPDGEAPVVSVQPSVFGSTLTRLRSELDTLRAFNDPRGIYARLPFQISF